ncbi:MAG: hypothetical protein HY319_12190 [Armatimonadetes bacterium]|nr:hypothetical protein [Armatimonadota bacterium]
MLPRVAAGQQPQQEEPEYVNERLQELEEAAAKAASGEWTVEQFGEYLEGVAQTLAEREQAIREIEIPPEAVEDFREELEVGFAGIQLYNEGVARMMMFVEDSEVSHLEEGIDLVRQGNEHINEAMRINRDNRKRLEEMYIDSSTMM